MTREALTREIGKVIAGQDHYDMITAAYGVIVGALHVLGRTREAFFEGVPAAEFEALMIATFRGALRGSSDALNENGSTFFPEGAAREDDDDGDDEGEPGPSVWVLLCEDPEDPEGSEVVGAYTDFALGREQLEELMGLHLAAAGGRYEIRHDNEERGEVWADWVAPDGTEVPAYYSLTQVEVDQPA